MGQFESLGDEGAILVGKEGSCRVFGVGEQVHMDTSVSKQGIVHDLHNCICTWL